MGYFAYIMENVYKSMTYENVLLIQVQINTRPEQSPDV